MIDTILYSDTILTIKELDLLNKTIEECQDWDDSDIWLECITSRIERSLYKLQRSRLCVV